MGKPRTNMAEPAASNANDSLKAALSEVITKTSFVTAIKDMTKLVVHHSSIIDL